MNADIAVLRGVVRPDGTLVLPSTVDVRPGPVEVTVRAVSPVTASPEDWWDVLQQIQARQAARGQAPPTAQEIDAEINAMRDEWEEHQLAIEQMQDDFRHQARQPPTEGAP